MVTKIKICGITRSEDMIAAVEAGADFVGIVREPSSPRFVTDDRIPELLSFAPADVGKVAVYAHFDPLSNVHQFDVIQSTDIRELPLGKRLWMVLRDEIRMRNASLWAQFEVENFLIDAYDPQIYGGTGKTVDLDLAAQVKSLLNRPLILAGGLNPQNVGEAIRKVRPFAVDVSSGVEDSPGIKDAGKIRAFVEAVREADRIVADETSASQTS